MDSDAMLNYQNRDGGVFCEEREFRPGVRCWNGSCCDVSGSQSARHAVDSALTSRERALAHWLVFWRAFSKGTSGLHLWTLWRRGMYHCFGHVLMLSPVFGGAPCQF